MEYRQAVLDLFVENQVFAYFEVWELLKKFYYEGGEGLPWVPEGFEDYKKI
jgi:hypothetical protein